MHVVSVYFILEHVLYFQTTCFPVTCLTLLIDDHLWTVQSIKNFIACSIICSISFFENTFRAEKLSISQIFGNFFERWRKCENIRISKKCQIEIFGATKNFSAQLKMITIFFENDDQGSRDGRPRTTSHYRTKPSKNFPYDFNTVWLFTALCCALPLITSKR